MNAAHAEAERQRAIAASIGYTTYSANKDDNYYANNYSPGESTMRPPAWLDWDDDGIIDIYQGGNIFDASGNQLNNGNIADWYVNPNDWYYNGPNSGGMEKYPTTSYTPSYSGGGGSNYYYTYTPYIPPRPSAPTPPPQEPPNPGQEPTFTKEKQVELVKYEYIYGIKDLQIRGNEYMDKSIYVSKPLDVDGNVMQVSLEAVEDHPVFDTVTGEASTRQTSVEYYISYVDNPSSEDWHPILPEGQKRILGQLLMFETARTASLRFPALTYEEATMYKDGIKFTEWSYTAGGTMIQLLTNHVPGSRYTIDYVPNAEIVNPWIIDIHEQGLKIAKHIETFPNGTNHNKTLNLSKYPYVDYEKVNLDGDFDPNTGYKPIQVRLKNANIAGPDRTTIKQVDPYSGDVSQKVYTKNITDYETKEWKVPKAYSLTKDDLHTAFEYWHEGSKLYFSETFNRAEILTNQEYNHGNAEVEVEYEYLISNFRVKIILRRNGLSSNSVSPMVHEYSLKFKVMK